jgi:hypothetical protein
MSAPWDRCTQSEFHHSSHHLICHLLLNYPGRRSAATVFHPNYTFEGDRRIHRQTLLAHLGTLHSRRHQFVGIACFGHHKTELDLEETAFRYCSGNSLETIAYLFWQTSRQFHYRDQPNAAPISLSHCRMAGSSKRHQTNSSIIHHPLQCNQSLHNSTAD